MSSNPCNYMDYGWSTLNGRPGLRMAVWSQVKLPRPRAYTTARLLPVGCKPTLSVTPQHRYSCSYRLWRYISVMLLPFTFFYPWQHGAGHSGGGTGWDQLKTLTVNKTHSIVISSWAFGPWRPKIVQQKRNMKTMTRMPASTGWLKK